MNKHYATHELSLAVFLAAVLSFFSFMPAASAQANDAGISAITGPVNPICAGSSNVTAVVHNYGTDSLTSVTLEWSVNGVAQTSVLLTDTIPSGSTDTVLLGTYPFLAATTNTILAYTTNPNGIADTVNTNDTARVFGLNVRLSGTYTVGGTSPDFARLVNAVTALNTYGVCGPVTINIRPMVDTAVKVAINAIPGANATNLILIQSENGDSTSVVLSQPSANMGMNDYLIRLNGADYITLCRLTLQRTGTNTLQHVIDFTNSATHNFVVHNRILGGATLGTGTGGALIFSTTTANNDSMNTFTDNRLEGGSYGIYLNGATATNTEYLNTVTDNIFVNQVTRAIHLIFQKDPLVLNNRVFSVSTNTNYSGIYLLRCQGNIQVVKNNVVTSHGFGLYLNTNAATALTPGLIVNNFLSAGDTAGVRIISCSYINLLNNSVLISGNGYSGLTVSGTGSGNIIENNILVNSGGGPSINITNLATAGILFSDYNNLFTTGANVGIYGGVPTALLSNWSAVTAQDNNSVSMNPQFVSPVDLHATSTAMDNLGVSLGYVPDDIDGEIRNATTPDIGADEYAPGVHDLTITAFVNIPDSLCAGAVIPVSVVISNTGTVAAGGFLVVTNVTGAVVTTLTQVRLQTILPGASDTLTYLGTLNTSGGGDVFFQSYASFPYDDNHANDTLYASRYYIPKPAMPVATSVGICGPGSVQLSASSADTLLWYDAFIGGNLVATGPTFTTPVLTVTTFYYVSAKGECESDRANATASIYLIPAVNLGNDTVANDSIVLNAGAGFTGYLWSTTDTTQMITVLATNSYSVIVTDTNGCTATDTIEVTIITGIRELALADEMLIYPNPANSNITLELNGIHAEKMNLRILNMLGAVQKEEMLVSSGSRLIRTYSVASLAKGIYILQLSSEEGMRNLRFTVE